MPRCGSQVILCGLPVRFDTYKGCSHFCRYCFAQRKKDLSDISVDETSKALRSFIEGGRTVETNWCDWDIPIHWGGMSDPFQPLEREKKVSLECLKVFAETGYPFVVSTKGRLITEQPYIDLIEKCNCVVQISMVCDKYDKLEQGAPTFDERLSMVQKVAERGKRVNIRIQPFMTEVYNDVMQNIKRFADAGAYGIIVEGMKFAKKQTGLVKVGGDYVYPKDILERQYVSLRDEAHKHGMKFYCGENRIRSLGDSLICCGIDGMDGFVGNEYNLCHMINGCKAKPTEKMKENGTANVMKALHQKSAENKNMQSESFAGHMMTYYEKRKEYIKTIFGK